MDDEELKRFWYDQDSAAYLTAPGALYHFLLGKGYNHVTLKRAKDFVARQPTYQQTKETKDKRESVPFVTTAPNLSQQCDLAFFKASTGAQRVALVCVDVFSSRIYAKLMQYKKTADATWRAYESLMEQMPMPPYYLATDRGSEFLSRKFVVKAREHGIRTRLMKTYQHASVAERAIGKIRQRWRRIQTETDTKDLAKYFAKIVSQLNRSPHSVHGIAPIDVTNANAGTVFRKRYGAYLDKVDKRPRGTIKEGTTVRLRTVSSASAKKSKIGTKSVRRFSKQLYTVHSVRATHPPTYTLTDENGKQLSRVYYPHELVDAAQ